MPLFSSFKQERGGVNFSFKLNKITIFMLMTPVPRVSVHLFMGANKYKKKTPLTTNRSLDYPTWLRA